MTKNFTAIALALILSFAVDGRGEVFRDRLHLDSGRLPHICCSDSTLTNVVNFAVDEARSNAWEVVMHGAGNYTMVVVDKGDILSRNMFEVEKVVRERSWCEARGNLQPFRFAFRCEKGSGDRNVWYGWISMAVDEEAKPRLLGSAMSMVPDELTVGDVEDWSGPDVPDVPGESNAQITDWRVVDYGNWVSLAEHCIPDSTVAGRVEVPQAIGGKPVKALEANAFNGYHGITTLVLPDGLENIADNSISDCLRLTRLIIPEGVTNIQCRGVSGLPSLGELKLPGSLKVIGEEAFYGNANLSNVTIRVGCGEIRRGAFGDCTALSKLGLPSSVETVEAAAFQHSGLAYLYVPRWTLVDTSSGWPGAEIVRYGLEMDRAGGYRLSGDGSDWRCLRKSIGNLDFEGATSMCLGVGRDISNESQKNALVCARLGISPVSILQQRTQLIVEYALPTIAITKFDVANRTIECKVTPAAGSRIVAEPLDGTITLRGINAGFLGGDYMYPPYMSVDYTDYLKSNGVLRFIIDDRMFTKGTHRFWKIVTGLYVGW